MKHGSLFSGIGGFDLAAEWMGWENVFHCEIDDFCNKILNYYWPNAKSYHNIKETDFTEWKGKIDVISGGFPCQPYSMAGKRKGKADDRHLWPEMLRAVREIQPRWIVGENVSGLLNWSRGMVLDEIKADLEASGFTVIPPLVLPACAVNAPHRRDRVWIVAYNNSIIRRERWNVESREQSRYGESILSVTSERNATNASIGGLETNDIMRESKGEINSSNPNSNGQQFSHSQYEINASKRRFDALNDIIENVIGNSEQQRLERPNGTQESKRFEQGYKNNNWSDFPTQPPLCSRDDGLSSELVGITFPKHRQESIKGYGNSVVPQVVFEIFKTISELENKIP